MSQKYMPLHVVMGQGKDETAFQDDAIRKTVQQAMHTRLRATPTPAAVCHMTDQVYRQADTLVAQSPQRAAQACAAGCCFCCSLPVDMTVPEALRIVAYVQAALPPALAALLRQRLASTAAQLHGLSFEEHAQARIPCALLVDGRCTVYAVRPLACRAWTSASRDCCEAVFHGDPVTMLPPLDTWTYDAVWSVARGLAAGVTQARLDGTTYELHSILHHLFATPDAVQQWLRGEEAFAGCTPGAFPG